MNPMWILFKIIISMYMENLVILLGVSQHGSRISIIIGIIVPKYLLNPLLMTTCIDDFIYVYLCLFKYLCYIDGLVD